VTPPRKPLDVAGKAPSRPLEPGEYLGHPSSLIGCACGQWHVPSRSATFEVNGVVHRHGLACYRAGESKQFGALPDEVDELRRLRSRVAFLESVLAVREGAGATRTAWGDAHDGVTTDSGESP
jgi:hypothetical protein